MSNVPSDSREFANNILNNLSPDVSEDSSEEDGNGTPEGKWNDLKGVFNDRWAPIQRAIEVRESASTMSEEEVAEYCDRVSDLVQFLSPHILSFNDFMEYSAMIAASHSDDTINKVEDEEQRRKIARLQEEICTDGVIFSSTLSTFKQSIWGLLSLIDPHEPNPEKFFVYAEPLLISEGKGDDITTEYIMDNLSEVRALAAVNMHESVTSIISSMISRIIHVYSTWTNRIITSFDFYLVLQHRPTLAQHGPILGCISYLLSGEDDYGIRAADYMSKFGVDQLVKQHKANMEANARNEEGTAESNS